MKVAEAIRFRVDGVPKPEPRARACVRGRHASVYKDRTSEAVEAWRSEVWARANEYRPDRPLRGPIRLYLMFTLKRPKKLFRRRDPEDELACDAVCDLDNLIKLVMDELTQLGYWKDDRQVYDVRAMKYYAAKDGTPGCEVVVFVGAQG